ncbi:interleukin-17A-like [Lissotriton helveticus]
MRFQRGTLMTLAFLAMVLVAHAAASETRRGRLRKGRSPRVRVIGKSLGLQNEKCPTHKSEGYYLVRFNDTVPVRESQLMGDIRTRSICPWTYRSDIDNQRYPTHISQAVCADSCGGFNLNPVEIKHQILVLRKEPNGCTFTLETMTVVVGCTCVTPNSILMDR